MSKCSQALGTTILQLRPNTCIEMQGSARPERPAEAERLFGPRQKVAAPRNAMAELKKKTG